MLSPNPRDLSAGSFGCGTGFSITGWNMSRKQWKMRFTSRGGAGATSSAQSIAGCAKTAPARGPRNQPVLKSCRRLLSSLPLNNGTMRAEHNQRKERDHDTAQSLRPSPRRFQGQPLGSGALRQPLHRLRLRDGQTTRLGMAGERTAGLRRSALPLGRTESLY